MWLLALLGCAHLRGGGGEGGPDARLVAADAAFAARAEGPARVEAAMSGWLELLAEDPEDAAVLARLAHARWVMALVEPDQAALHLELGEAYGWRCLQASPAFAVALRVRHFQVTRDAAASLGRADAPCLAWTLANGLDRVALRGPGATLELEPLGLLADRLRALAPAAEGGVGFWAAARERLLDPRATERQRTEARSLLAAAIAAEPGLRVWRADLAAAFPDARDVLDVPASSPDPFALENGAAAARYDRERAREVRWAVVAR